MKNVVDDLHSSLHVRTLNELSLDGRDLCCSDVHRPGMALMGFMKNFVPGRIQVLGESEMAYLISLDRSDQYESIQRLHKLEAPAVIVTSGLDVPPRLIETFVEFDIPLLGTSMPTEEFLQAVTIYFNDVFAPRTELHASLVDVYGMGMLITGPSGIGKSECALDLVERGHRLVADDIVEIRKASEEVIIGRFRDVLQHNLEIRGVGVINVQAIFGIRGIRRQKRIELEFNLQHWRDDQDYERTGLERHYTQLLGVKIPRIEVPIVPGKNLTVIAEVTALDFMMRIYGIDAAQDLNRRIMETLRSGDGLQNYLRNDRE